MFETATQTAEYGQTEYGRRPWRQRRRWGGGYGQDEYGQNEYGQSENGHGEVGEAEEQFLHKVFLKVLGQEAEQGESVLSPVQEAEFAARLLEVSNEQEFGQLFSGIVNAVGRAVQGVRGAANSPQGRALIDAVKPLARAALPAVGGALGGAFAPGIGSQIGRQLGTAASSLFEAETSELSQEQQEFETARRVVRLTAAAARDVATAPPGAPAQLVGELGLFRAARRFASPLFRRALGVVSPYTRRFYGGRYGGFRRGYGYGRGYRYGYGRPYLRYPGYGRRYGYGPGYPAPYGYPVPPPQPEPGPEPGPPPEPPAQPGYRWVAVPIGAPAPTGEPPAGADPSAQASPQSEFGSNGQSGGPGGRWVRRDNKIIVLGA